MKTNYLKNISPEKFGLFFVLLLALIYRFTTTQMIQDGGDAINAWFAAKSIINGFPYSWSHITARFSIIIPALFSQLIFGEHPIVYYLVPAITSIGQVYFLYKIGLMVRGKYLATFSCIILLIFPEMVVNVSHLKPEAFSTLYVLMALFFLLKFIRDEKDKFIYFSSISIFLAYLAKIDNLFFVPAFLLIIYVHKKSVKTILKFISPMFFLYIIETVFYLAFTDFKFGRLSVIFGGHLATNYFDLKTGQSFCIIFQRYVKLMLFWKLLLGFGFISSCFLWMKKYARNINTKAIVFSIFSYILFITFTIKSLSPFSLAIPFEQRYFSVLTPFLIISLLLSLFILFDFIISSPFKKKLHDNFRKISLTLIVFFAFSFSIIFAYSYPSFYQEKYYKLKSYYSLHPMNVIPKYYSLLNHAYSKNIPIVTTKFLPKRFKDVYNKVNIFLKKGMKLPQALKKANISLKVYNTAINRLKSGDYKAHGVFVKAFLRAKFMNKKRNPVFPQLKKKQVNGVSIGYVMQNNKPFLEKLKNKDYNFNVIFIDINLFKARKIMFKKIIE